MSRRCAGLLALFAAAAASGTASAQDISDEDRAIARNLMQRQGSLAPPVRRRCVAPTTGEIVVCAIDNEQFRAQSTAQADPSSKQATNDGRLTPPDVSGKGIFKGAPTMGGMCLIPPCPAQKAYIADLSQIPPAPAGSDADKIAKGELRAR